MKKRKMLYGYVIEQGELQIQPKEAKTVRRVVTLYAEGLSYQKISDVLNEDGIPFSSDVPAWNKHKVKRLLENPRYTGTDGYPSIIDQNVFQEVQLRIRDKTAHYRKKEKPPKASLPIEEISDMTYIPSSEVVRLTNAINRGLECPDKPEDVVNLIAKGISARYNCLK